MTPAVAAEWDAHAAEEESREQGATRQGSPSRKLYAEAQAKQQVMKSGFGGSLFW